MRGGRFFLALAWRWVGPGFGIIAGAGLLVYSGIFIDGAVPHHHPAGWVGGILLWFCYRRIKNGR